MHRPARGWRRRGGARRAVPDRATSNLFHGGLRRAVCLRPVCSRLLSDAGARRLSRQDFPDELSASLEERGRGYDAAQLPRGQANIIWKHRDLAPLITTTFRWRPRYWSVPYESKTLQTELALIPPGSRVLEVALAVWHLTQALKRQGCEVTGIELDPALASMSGSLRRRMVVGNIEDLDLDAEVPEEFDVILCGDVLKYLTDPEAVLQKLKRRLASTGYLVVSVPNVAHGRVRLSLLEGQ